MYRVTRRVGLMLLVVSTLNLAQDRSSLSLGGHVKAAFQLEPVAASSRTGMIVRTERLGETGISVTFQAGPDSHDQTHEAVVVVALRTNAAAYRLLATPSSQRSPITITATVVAPSGNGTLVASQALADFRGAKSLVVSAADSQIASGTRISIGGRFPSPDNAISVEIRLVSPVTSPGPLWLRIVQ